MTNKSIIIIGAGIAGLAAGCYGQMNGYKTRIFELHDKPGGLCTAWKRSGYTIDGCLHWLVGSSPGQGFYPIWQELGALQGRQVYNHDIFMQAEGSGGGIFNLYTDLGKLEQHMLEIAPEDRDATRHFIREARTCAKYDPPVDKAPELYGLADIGRLFRFFPLLRLMSRWNKVTISQFASKFKNPLIREGFTSVWYPDFSFLFLLMTHAWLHNRVAGYTIGGSLEFARAIEKRYMGLGGELSYRSKVSSILVEDGKAVGVRLEDGTEHRADTVISAADGYATIFEMLGGKYIDEKIKGYYDKFPIFQPLVFASFGVNRAFAETARCVSGINFPVNPPLSICGRKVDRLTAHIYNFDPTMAPAGKTAVTVMVESRFEYWNNLKQNEQRYKAEKEKIAGALVSVLDRRFPGFASQVEMTDIATPVTFKRYTGNWQGSFEGWMITPETAGVKMSKKLPGLDNFYMIGQWVEPGGGLPTAAFSARNVMQVICNRDKKKFVTSVPQEHDMKALTEYLWFDTGKEKEFINITGRVEEMVSKSGIREGMVLVSAMHITAGVYVNDAEMGLIRDIEDWLEKLAPAQPGYRHHATGETNGDAHLKSLLVHHQVIVPITGGRLDLGPWQQVYYAEFDGRRRKRVILKAMGE